MDTQTKVTYFIFSTCSWSLYLFIICLSSLQCLWTLVPSLSFRYDTYLYQIFYHWFCHLYSKFILPNVIHLIHSSSNVSACNLTSSCFISSLWFPSLSYIWCLFSLHIILTLSDFLVILLNSLFLIFLPNNILHSAFFIFHSYHLQFTWFAYIITFFVFPPIHAYIQIL